MGGKRIERAAENDQQKAKLAAQLRKENNHELGLDREAIGDGGIGEQRPMPHEHTPQNKKSLLPSLTALVI